MQISHLEHVLRASGAIVDEKVMIVIGSQALLGSIPHPPAELAQSEEADLYPRDAPEKAELITGSIGEMSPFHETFGYHGDGVSPTTEVLPAGWQERLVPLHNENTGGVTGLCLHPIDIAISKLAAGRDKDMAYVRALVRHGIVHKAQLHDHLAGLDPQHRARVEPRLAGLPEEG